MAMSNVKQFMSHRKSMHIHGRTYMRLCFTSRDSVSTNQEWRFRWLNDKALYSKRRDILLLLNARTAQL